MTLIPCQEVVSRLVIIQKLLNEVIYPYKTSILDFILKQIVIIYLPSTPSPLVPIKVFVLIKFRWRTKTNLSQNWGI